MLADIAVLIPSPSRSHPCPRAITLSVPFQSLPCPGLHPHPHPNPTPVPTLVPFPCTGRIHRASSRQSLVLPSPVADTVSPQRWQLLTTPIWGHHHLEYLTPEAEAKLLAPEPPKEKATLFETVI